ncbi:MAG: AAA family ATPase [Bacteroidota bacterium]
MNFLIITGPPAVGKMTVGQVLSQRLGYPLFHNHHSIELTLDLFAWGTPEFRAINSGIRELVFKTASASQQLPGFIFTVVFAFDYREDIAEGQKVFDHFIANGWKPHLVELYAPLEKRLERNSTPNRLAHKASKRKLELSRENLLKMEGKYSLNSGGEEVFPGVPHLRIDNTDRTAEEVADMIVQEFGWVVSVVEK